MFTSLRASFTRLRNLTGKRKSKEYLIIEGEGASRTVRFNTEAVREEELRFGYFVLASNCEKDPFKALEFYRSREKIEDLFSVQKNTMDGRRPRVWYPENQVDTCFSKHKVENQQFKGSPSDYKRGKPSTVVEGDFT